MEDLDVPRVGAVLRGNWRGLATVGRCRTQNRASSAAPVRSAQPPAPLAAPELILPTTNVHYLATGATTGGDFGLYRWEMAGPPSGPAPHFHRSITESFYVLSGTVGLYDGASDRRRCRRLPFRPARRRPRLPQRAREAGLDADSLHPGRAA